MPNQITLIYKKGERNIFLAHSITITQLYALAISIFHKINVDTAPRTWINNANNNTKYNPAL